MEKARKPDIFLYDDYRRFLQDQYRFAKSGNRAFSYRIFSRQAGFASPNFLKLVMDGKRNLTRAALPKFVRALKLNKIEADFLEALVGFNQAADAEEKNFYYEKMSRSRRFRTIKGLQRDQYEYFSQWYYCVVRELVTLKNFHEDPQWIAQQLLPRLTPREAQEALELLLRLNLLQRGADGRLRQVDTAISTPDELRSLAAMQTHRRMLEKASELLHKVPAEARDYSTLTLGVPAERLPQLKKMVADFRSELLSVIGKLEEPVDRVYQLNIQLFPMTKDDKS